MRCYGFVVGGLYFTPSKGFQPVLRVMQNFSAPFSFVEFSRRCVSVGIISMFLALWFVGMVVIVPTFRFLFPYCSFIPGNHAPLDDIILVVSKRIVQFDLLIDYGVGNFSYFVIHRG